MNLKGFHIFFIFCSVILAFGFGFWNINQPETGNLIGGILSFLVGGFLLVYGIYFYRKMFLTMIPFVTLLSSPKVWACATCFGDPNSLQTRGMNSAILFMLVITALMLTSFFVFFVFLWRNRQKDIS